jgi:hypothetical protein
MERPYGVAVGITRLADGAEPIGRSGGVPGTDVEIGGVNPDLEP